MCGVTFHFTLLCLSRIEVFGATTIIVPMLKMLLSHVALNLDNLQPLLMTEPLILETGIQFFYIIQALAVNYIEWLLNPHSNSALSPTLVTPPIVELFCLKMFKQLVYFNLSFKLLCFADQ